MGLKGPPADLAQRRLSRVQVPEQLVRISRTGYADPFFWSRLGRSRFDLPDGRYGVLYTGEDLETCVIEVFGDRWLNERILSLQSLAKFEVLTFAVKAKLHVADLTGPMLNLIGADANLFASNDYSLTQQWSRQLMAHPQSRDGLRYRSRKNPQKQNYAIYDTARAKAGLRLAQRRRLGVLPGLYPILDKYQVALID